MTTAHFAATPRDRVRLSDEIVQQLTSHIVSGQMKTGDVLPSEAELCRQFAVSKTVVREALRQLSALGVVEVHQGRSTTVGELAAEPLRNFFRFALHISPDGLREAIELRQGIERQAAILAAQNITDEEIPEFRGRYKALANALNDHLAWVTADVEFHQALARYSHNPLIAFMVSALKDSMHEVISTLNARVEIRNPADTLKRHRAIVDAVCARDPLAAAAAMDGHFACARLVVEATRPSQ